MVGRPLAFKDDSVWAVGSKYYVNGKPNNISVATILATDPNDIRKQLEEYGPLNSDDGFKRYKTAFVEANKEHLGALVREASDFIVKASEGYPDEHLVVSFSGGKDSTVTADLAVRALSNPYLVHIFGNTTLEFPSTIEYAKRFRDNHPLAIFKVAKNYEQDFYDVANVIGPPARTMRWCCSMFKTGPISRAFKGLFGDEPILTFYGIRKNESVSRSKYNRVEDSAESVKIQRQKVASPIFYWNDCDVWLYILSEGIDFNDAYRLGYERVGCWMCPNNNPRAQFLSQIYMPEQSERWRTFLVDFARRIGKPDPEVYVDTGKWKARQGGNGVAAAENDEFMTVEFMIPADTKPSSNYYIYLSDLLVVDENGNDITDRFVCVDTIFTVEDPNPVTTTSSATTTSSTYTTHTTMPYTTSTNIPTTPDTTTTTSSQTTASSTSTTTTTSSTTSSTSTSGTTSSTSSETTTTTSTTTSTTTTSSTSTTQTTTSTSSATTTTTTGTSDIEGIWIAYRIIDENNKSVPYIEEENEAAIVVNNDLSAVIKYHNGSSKSDIEGIKFKENGDALEVTLFDEKAPFNMTRSGDDLIMKPDNYNYQLCFKQFAFGDINRDGKVDSSDASYILSAYAKSATGGSKMLDETIALGDTDGNGILDSKDASTILAFYAYRSTGGKEDLYTFIHGN